MFGARWTKYQLDPAPLPSVSISFSSGSPCARANAIASETASMMPAHMIWFVALAAWPAPVGPKCVTVLPIAASSGRARSKASSLPPAMIAKVASRAPSVPPLTGQSRKSAERGAISSAALRAVSEPTVEQSMTSAPERSLGASAPTTCSTSSSAETQITTASTLPASSASVSGAWHPNSPASAAAFSWERFQTAPSRPARWRLRAMCIPIAPRPTNPTRILAAPYNGHGRERRREGATIVQSRVRIDFARAEGGTRTAAGTRLLLGSGRGIAEVFHVIAYACPIGIRLRVRQVLLLAVLVVLGDAARADGLVVGILGILALLLAHLGEILLDGLHGRRGGLWLSRLRIRARGRGRRVRGARGARGVRGRSLAARGLDQLRARDPLVTVMVDALRILPAIDVRIRMGQPGHADAGSQDQGNAHSSQHRHSPAAPV